MVGSPFIGSFFKGHPTMGRVLRGARQSTRRIRAPSPDSFASMFS